LHEAGYAVNPGNVKLATNLGILKAEVSGEIIILLLLQIPIQSYTHCSVHLTKGVVKLSATTICNMRNTCTSMPWPWIQKMQALI
jgi:hypothetical protein